MAKYPITESTKFDEPSDEYIFENQHLYKIHKIWRFKNGYGASVIRVKDKMTNEYMSYTNNNEEWELAVIKFTDSNNYELVYNTEITNDVIGYLKKEEVEEILRKIKKLKKTKRR